MTTLTVRIPQVQPQRYASAAPRPMPRVLIAQADPAARRRLATALRCDGYAIIELASAAQLEAFWLEGPDGAGQADVSAVVAELDLRDPSAADVLACLHLCDSRIPLILLAPYADRRMLDQAYRLGVIAIFGISYDLDVLRALLRRIASVDESIATIPAA